MTMTVGRVFVDSKLKLCGDGCSVLWLCHQSSPSSLWLVPPPSSSFVSLCHNLSSLANGALRSLSIKRPESRVLRIGISCRFKVSQDYVVRNFSSKNLFEWCFYEGLVSLVVWRLPESFYSIKLSCVLLLMALSYHNHLDSGILSLTSILLWLLGICISCGHCNHPLRRRRFPFPLSKLPKLLLHESPRDWAWPISIFCLIGPSNTSLIQSKPRSWYVSYTVTTYGFNTRLALSLMCFDPDIFSLRKSKFSGFSNPVYSSRWERTCLHVLLFLRVRTISESKPSTSLVVLYSYVAVFTGAKDATGFVLTKLGDMGSFSMS